MSEVGEKFDWREYEVYFRADGNLTKLRLDPGNGAGDPVEFDWIRLEKTDQQSIGKRVAELRQRVEQGIANVDEVAQLGQLIEIVSKPTAEPKLSPSHLAHSRPGTCRSADWIDD